MIKDIDAMEKKNISLFFGAGAEINYGLPSGGKFALDIFKMDTAEDKIKFKSDREKVDKKSHYAKNWLPFDFEKKPISSFGKSQYESLVKSSLEYKRFEILKYLSIFDDKVEKLVTKISKQHKKEINNIFEDITQTPFGTDTYGHEIKISATLGNHNKVFSSKYFSSFLKILELEKTDSNTRLKRHTKNFCRAVIELLIGACGEELINNLNDGIFEKKPDEMDIFDDLGGIFSLDYRSAGLAGLELLLNRENDMINAASSNEEIICYFALEILEDIFSACLDYQSLIDSNWRYLYSPKTDWAKFCRISIFLNTTRRYIYEIAEQNRSEIIASDGFYHDIEKIKKNNVILSIGTTNYNDFVSEISKENIYFLNGSVNDFYDPYLNTTTSKLESESGNHFTVPFLFTQSGIKPLTSIKMSKRYVDIYDQMKTSDSIAIVGYGFNSDDGHINGMFRSLIEEENKTITIFHYTEYFSSDSDITLKSHYQERLRLKSSDGLNIVKINSSRENEEGQIWHSCL